MDKEFKEANPSYRNYLIEGESKAQEQFDRSLLTMAGGALGISFAFVDKFIGNDEVQCAYLLITAWSFWGFTMLSALVSLYLAPNVNGLLKVYQFRS